MRIGILTFHDGINHGGFFQAYSTFMFLKRKGYSVEIINYKNKRHWLLEYKAFLVTKRPKVLLENIRKIFAFKKDQRRMLFSRFTTKVNRISQSYDVIVVGSDIVWNYEWHFLGQDPIYFGHGLASKKLISYAPSFGAVNCKTTVIPSYVKSGLEKFSAISVRDENSACVVRKAINLDPEVVVDPTFLLDTRGMEEEVQVPRNYLLIYAHSLSKSEINNALNFAHKRRLEVVAIGYSQTWADYNVISPSPFEWLGYFEKADYVLTGTFHGTIYAIKYKKNFVTCDNKGISNKTKTILERLGISHRLVSGDEDFSGLYSAGIDYEKVDKVLSPWVSRSEKFLLEAIEK